MHAAAQFALRTSHDPILIALNEHSVLSPAQLTRLLYRPGSLTYAYEQLRLLAAHRYAAPFMLVPPMLPARPRVVYGLGSAGRARLRRLGVPITTRYRPCEDRQRTSSHLAHTLAIADTVIAARLLSRVVPAAQLVEVVSERTFKQWHERVTFQRRDGAWERVTVIPDALLHLTLPGDSQQPIPFPIVLEVDRGTAHRKAFERMLRSRLAWAKSPFYSRFNVACQRLAVVVAMEQFAQKRLAQLLAWTRAVLKDLWLEHAKEADWFRFTIAPAAATDPRAFFFAPHWHRPFDASPVPLVDPRHYPLTAPTDSPKLRPIVIWEVKSRSSGETLRRSQVR